MITGPVKFAFYTGKVERHAMAFWCVMMRRELFDELGLLDEIFSPGTGEDGDFCIRAELAGHPLVQVPIDGSHTFGTGEFKTSPFMIYHHGSATFGYLEGGSALINRNRQILNERYAMLPPVEPRKFQAFPEDAPEGELPKLDEDEAPGLPTIEQKLEEAADEGGCDRTNHIGIIETCLNVKELEDATGLTAHKVVPGVLPFENNEVQPFEDIAPSSLPMLNAIEYRELKLPKGTMPETVKSNIDNGKVQWVFGRSPKFKYSIVIPTYNHCDDLLKPCIESILKYTDMSNVEIIVVANGCTDGTFEYLSRHPLLHNKKEDLLKLVWHPEAMGFTKATNLGIRCSQGEFIILLNNDTVLLEQPKNQWLQMLEEPFHSKQTGLTGPLMLHDDYANYPVLIFFCVMVRREVFNAIGLLDEIFSPGGGEDIDFSVRAEQAGFKISLSRGGVQGDKMSPNTGQFPIWHKENQTFKEINEYTTWIIKRNGHINCKRYNKDIKLNIGGGGIRIPGYLSLDAVDGRADIKMDAAALDFETNSVSSIIASHIFEHLNPYKVQDILIEWMRVLKPGGRLIMEMPDIEQLCLRFVSSTKAERYGILNAVYGSVNTTGKGPQSEITSPHLFGWWPESIWDTLWSAGYVNVAFGPEQWPHPESNMHVEASKPIPNREELGKREFYLYTDIFKNNVYNVKDEEIRGKVVIDVGANVGMFSLFALEHGAKEIHAIEAQPVIWREGLQPNTVGYPQIHIYNYAILGTGGELVRIENNHVGSKVGEVLPPASILSEQDSVYTLTLERFLTQFVDQRDKDLVLKMDIEGCEFDVLYATMNHTLQRFGTIYIEVHESEKELRHSLHSRLKDVGFSMAYEICDTTNKHCWVEKWLRTKYSA